MSTPSGAFKRPRMVTELSTGGTHGRQSSSENKKPKWQNLEGISPRKIKLEEMPSTNMLLPADRLTKALDKLTCLECHAETEGMSMTTKTQGLATVRPYFYVLLVGLVN